MANEITQPQGDGVVYARIRGLTTLADQRTLEALAKRLVEAGQKVRLLAILEAFEGWGKSEARGDDLQFMPDYGNQIARIAIVGEEAWKDRALLFVGRGFRNTQIEFFPTGSADAAQAWIGDE